MSSLGSVLLSGSSEYTKPRLRLRRTHSQSSKIRSSRSLESRDSSNPLISPSNSFDNKDRSRSIPGMRNSSDQPQRDWRRESIDKWTTENVASFIEELGPETLWKEYALKCAKMDMNGRGLLAAEELHFIRLGFATMDALKIVRAVKDELRNNLLGSANSTNPLLSSSDNDAKHDVKPNRSTLLSSSEVDVKRPLHSQSEAGPDAASDHRASISTAATTDFAALNMSFKSQGRINDDDDAGSVASSRSEVSYTNRNALKKSAIRPAGVDTAADRLVESVHTLNPTKLGEMVNIRHSLWQYLKDHEEVSLDEKLEGKDKDTDDDDDDDSGYESQSSVEEDPGYKLAEHRTGFFNRLFKTGEVKDGESLLAFQKALINVSLLKCNRKNDRVAIQLFKCITAYMGDRRGSKPQAEYARRIVLIGLLSHKSMRDELYLQLCKQTHMNPGTQSTLQGWSLILLCLMSFLPSPKLRIMDHIDRTLAATQEQGVKERVIMAKKIMAMQESAPPRAEMPPTIEVESVAKLSLIPVEVKLPSKTFKGEPRSISILVDPLMTIAEAERLIAKKLGISFQIPFGLYEANKDAMEVCLDRRRVCDVMSSWSQSVEDVREILNESAKKKRRVREEQEQEKFHLQSKSMSDLTRAAAKLRSKTEDLVRYDHFVFQAKLLPHTSGPRRVREMASDSVGLDIAYCQVRDMILSGRLRIEERDVAKCAALQLQVEQGDYNKEVNRPGCLITSIHNFVPAYMLPEKKKLKKDEDKLYTLEARILEKYAKLVTIRVDQAKAKYLSYAERSEQYGMHFYLVRQRRQMRKLPEYLNLGISMENIFIQNPDDGKIVKRYKLTDVVSWGYSNTKFILVVGDVVQQIKYFFRTLKGDVMKRLIQIAININVNYTKQRLRGRSPGRGTRSARSRSLTSRSSSRLSSTTFGLDTRVEGMRSRSRGRTASRSSSRIASYASMRD
uniref:SAM domain-containing protein n=1 Tax=Lotharella globosa TaxID=91324 RepID=A0A7S3ZFD8_9EUKA